MPLNPSYAPQFTTFPLTAHYKTDSVNALKKLYEIVQRYVQPAQSANETILTVFSIKTYLTADLKVISSADPQTMRKQAVWIVNVPYDYPETITALLNINSILANAQADREEGAEKRELSEFTMHLETLFLNLVGPLKVLHKENTGIFTTATDFFNAIKNFLGTSDSAKFHEWIREMVSPQKREAVQSEQKVVTKNAEREGNEVLKEALESRMKAFETEKSEAIAKQTEQLNKQQQEIQVTLARTNQFLSDAEARANKAEQKQEAFMNGVRNFLLHALGAESQGASEEIMNALENGRMPKYRLAIQSDPSASATAPAASRAFPYPHRVFAAAKMANTNSRPTFAQIEERLKQPKWLGEERLAFIQNLMRLSQSAPTENLKRACKYFVFKLLQLQRVKSVKEIFEEAFENYPSIKAWFQQNVPNVTVGAALNPQKRCPTLSGTMRPADLDICQDKNFLQYCNQLTARELSYYALILSASKKEETQGYTDELAADYFANAYYAANNSTAYAEGSTVPFCEVENALEILKDAEAAYDKEFADKYVAEVIPQEVLKM